jgi:peptide/nickel transport system permease protein
MLQPPTVATERQSDVLGSGAGLAAAEFAETGTELGELAEVKARGYWELVWLRFRRDRIAVASGLFIVLLFIIAFAGAPLAERWVGHGPNEDFIGTKAIETTKIRVDLGGGQIITEEEPLRPAGPWTWINAIDIDTGKTERELLVLGGDSFLGRDEFLRLLYGAQVSLEVAVLSTIGVMIIGILLGSIAGFFRGWIDGIISRVTEITMAFPALLFIIALAATVGPRLDGVTLGFFGKGVITLVLVFSVFGWFYPARIIRAQVLSIREKEYIEAARMIGATDARIIRSHVLPHLVAPIIVYSTLIVAQYILAEAGLSFLGLGIKTPTASWGNLLADTPQYYTTQPWLMLWPGLAVLLTTLAFNLLGDGLRDAFDPRAGQH